MSEQLAPVAEATPPQDDPKLLAATEATPEPPTPPATPAPMNRVAMDDQSMQQFQNIPDTRSAIENAKAMLYDRQGFGGKAPQALLASKTKDDPQAFRDGTAAVAGMSAILGIPAETVAENFTQYQNRIEGAMGWDHSPSVSGFANNLASHFQTQDQQHQAIQNLQTKTVQNYASFAEKGMSPNPLVAYSEFAKNSAFSNVPEEQKVQLFNSVYSPIMKQLATPEGQKAVQLVNALQQNKEAAGIYEQGADQASADVSQGKEAPNQPEKIDPVQFLKGMPDEQQNKVISLAAQLMQANQPDMGNGLKVAGGLSQAFSNGFTSWGAVGHLDDLVEAEKRLKAAQTPEDAQKAQDDIENIKLSQKIKQADQQANSVNPELYGLPQVAYKVGQGVAGMPGSLAPALVPVLGEFAFYKQAQAEDALKLMEQNPGMSAEEAKGRVTIASAAYGITMGRLAPLLGEASPGLTGFLIHTAQSTAIMQGAEGERILGRQLQSLVDPSFNPKEQYGQEWLDLLKATPYTFATLAAFGGAIKLMNRGQVPDPNSLGELEKQAGNARTLQYLGFDAETAQKIASLPEGQRVKALGSEWDKRTDEQKQAGVELARQDAETANKVISDPAAPKVEQTPDGKYVVTSKNGDETHVATFDTPEGAKQGLQIALTDHQEKNAPTEPTNDWVTATEESGATPSSPVKDEVQTHVDNVSERLDREFGGSLPSSVEVVHEPDANWNAKIEGGKIQVNAAHVDPEQAVHEMNEELAHAVWSDEAARPAFEELWNALPEDVQNKINDHVQRLYGDKSADIQHEETRAKAVKEMLRLKDNPETKGAWDKFVETIKGIWEKLTSAKATDPEAIASRIIEIGKAKIQGVENTRFSLKENEGEEETKSRISDLLDQYHSGEGVEDFGDLISHLKNLEAEWGNLDLHNALMDYHDAVREDYKEYGGRGDFEGYENKLIADIEKISKGESLNNSERFSLRDKEEDGFYSQLQRTIADKMPNKASVEQIRAIIDPAKGSGVKPDEIKWSNLEGFLEGKKSVTKQEVLDYLRNEGAIKFEEKKLSDKSNEQILRDKAKTELIANGNANPSESEIQEYLNEYGNELDDAGRESENAKPKYGQGDLVTPGGENYREVVLTMPEGMGDLNKIAQSLFGKDYSDLTEQSERRKVVKETREKGGQIPDSYRSSHFPDIPNYVAHMRLDERTDSSGKPGLFIEEIQSDRHQAGREKGYVDLQKAEEMKRLGKIERELSDQAIAMKRKLLEEAIDVRESPEYQALQEKIRENSDQIKKLNDEGGATGIPDAPFRKDWSIQMFKRALRDAIASGKEWIGWTTGKTQADRYDKQLADNLDEIHVRKAEDGKSYYVLGYKDGKETIDSGAVSQDKLADLIGKDMAVKAIESKEDSIKFSGESLSIGGKGMEGFYDQILPKEIGKYVKKWGAKVEEGDVKTDPKEYDTTPIWKVEITPEMRKSIEQHGQARFSLKERDEAYDKAVKSGNEAEQQRLVDKAAKEAGYDSDKDLHHGTTHDFTVFSTERSNVENDMGKGFYFSSNPSDVENNYAGEGPDLTSRIERKKEQIHQELDDIETKQGLTDYAKNHGIDLTELKVTPYAGKPETALSSIRNAISLEIARKELNGGNPKTLKTYVRLENPAILGGKDQTILEMSHPYDEEGEPLDEEPTGTLVDFTNALKEAAMGYGNEEDVAQAASELMEKANYESIPLSEAIEFLKQHEGIAYVEDPHTGDIAGNELIREALEETGYDGIVDNTVNQKFGSERRAGKQMAGMDEDTYHVIAFDPSQIKSADPITYDDAGNVIPLSERFNPQSNDIRFSKKDDQQAKGAKARAFFNPIVGDVPPPPTLRERAADIAARVASTVRDLPKDSEFKRQLLQWSARSQASSNEVERVQHTIETTIKDKAKRDGITNWIEAGGDRSLLLQRAEASKDPKVKAGYEAAANFTPDEIKVAQKVRDTFNILEARAKKWGIDMGHRENYVPHVYEQEPQPPSGSSSKRLSEFFKFSQERTFESYFGGEQAGYKPQTKDISKLLGLYLNDMNNAINSRRFVAELSKGKASDGRPLVSPRGSGTAIKGEHGESEVHLVYPDSAKEGHEDYKVMDQPALHDWSFAGTDENGKNILVKGDLAVHPEIAEHFNNALGSSLIRKWWNTKTENPFLNATKTTAKFLLDDLQGYVKGTMLSFSPFHQVQEGIHAIGHRINPFADIPQIDLRKPEQADAVAHGLMLSHDRLSQSLFMEGVGANDRNLVTMGLRKIGWGLTTAAADKVDAYQHWLFSQYIPGLKLKTYEHILERNMERFKVEIASGKATEFQVKNLSAQQANAAYGHLNYTEMGHNPTIRHAFQIALLAPDFLEARARFVGQSLKALTGAKTGSEQLQAFAFLAVTQVVVATIQKVLTNGDPELDHPFEMRFGNKYYGMRSVPEDVYKAFNNPTGFIGGRISPIFGRFVQEGVFGVNYRGEHTTVGDAIKDILAGTVPMPMQTLTRQWTDSSKANPISPFEQILSSAGVQVHRYSPITTIYPIAEKWVKANHPEDIRARGAYPVSKFQQLRYACEDGDAEKIQHEVKNLEKAGMTLAQIAKGFKSSVNHPFTGKESHDEEMVKTLSEDDKESYHAAVERRKVILQRFNTLGKASE